MLASYYLNWINICPMILPLVLLHFLLFMAWILKTHSWMGLTRSRTWWMVIVLTTRPMHVPRFCDMPNHPWRFQLWLHRLLLMGTLGENSRPENFWTICSMIGIQPNRTRPKGPNLVKKLKLWYKDLKPLLNCTGLESVFSKWQMVRWRQLIPRISGRPSGVQQVRHRNLTHPKKW